MKEHYLNFKIEDMNINQTLPDYDFTEFGPPEIVIFVAPKGSRIIKDNVERTSDFGHVFVGARGINQQTKRYETHSIGFSAGENWKTHQDNISFSDHLHYADASTLAISSDTPKFNRDLQNLFNVIGSYKSGGLRANNYNLFDNNCIGSAKQVLDQAGIYGIEFDKTPSKMLKKLKWAGNKYKTPLLIDLNGNGVKTIASHLGVNFDFEGVGNKSQTGWAAAEDAFLVRDIDQDGFIRYGAELFGENTQLKDNLMANDGFEALSAFDDNLDGIMDKKDSVWSELSIWQDKNSDGISQKNELIALNQIGIVSIELAAIGSEYIDENDNHHKLVSKVNWSDNKQTDIVDVWFHQNSASLSLLSIMQEKNVDNIVEAISSFLLSEKTGHSLSLIASPLIPLTTSISSPITFFSGI